MTDTPEAPMEIMDNAVQDKEEYNSDTSEDEEIEQIMKDVKNPKKKIAGDQSEMDAESVAFSTSTYRTKNEIDQNDINQILRFMPKMVDKEIGSINPLGKVENFIPPHTLFVKKEEDSKDILDLDNFVCNEKKELIGYIDEVVGPVVDPFYTVVLYPAFKEQCDKEEIDLEAMFKGNKVYFVEKTKKLVFWNNLLNQRGCDASNMYDEEVDGESEEEFSDDEQEKAFKKIVKKVKNQRKRKRREMEGGLHPNQQKYNPADGYNRKRDLKGQNVHQYQAQPPYPYQPPAHYGQNMQSDYAPSYAPQYQQMPNIPPATYYPQYPPAPYPYQAQQPPQSYNQFNPNFPNPPK